MKLLKDLGALALGTRLATTGELLYEEVQAIYRAQDIDFDPRNFLLFKALVQDDDPSVCALAREIHCTHARASQKLSELEKQKLVERIQSDDGRKSCYRLSMRGRQLVQQLDPVWTALEQTLRTDFGSAPLLEQVERFEELMQPGRLSSQVLARLAKPKNERRAPAFANLSFKVLQPPFSALVCSEFERLNRAWIKENNFNLEGSDEELFSDLSDYVRTHQGVLFIGESENTIVATAILLIHGESAYELAKFCVDKDARGLGIGKRLLAICETEARVRGAKQLTLETSSKLVAALKLYQKAGYIAEPASGSAFARVDLKMTKQL